MWQRNSVGEDQKAKETAAPESTSEVGGNFHRLIGLDDPVRQRRVMGKYSEVTGRWLAQPARRKASIPTSSGEAEGPRLWVEEVTKEIRVIGGDSGHEASVPQKTPTRTSKPGAAGRRRAAGTGLKGGSRVPCVRRRCLSGTCSLRAARCRSRPAPAPVPPPGTGRGASPGGGRGWRGGSPGSAGGLPRQATARLGHLRGDKQLIWEDKPVA